MLDLKLNNRSANWLVLQAPPRAVVFSSKNLVSTHVGITFATGHHEIFQILREAI